MPMWGTAVTLFPIMTALRHFFLEPISALTHLIGAVASLLGMVLLLALTWDQPAKMVSLFIYGMSMVALYTASALLHGVKTDDERRMWLNRLDHAAIFLLIAGTYTPIVWNILPAPLRWLVLTVVWLVAALGSRQKLRGQKIHGFLDTSIYVFLGWGSAAPLLLATNLIDLVPWHGLALLLLGGFIYTGGFLVYYFRWPDPWPDTFGHHEVWHLFVMGGSLCHYLFMLLYVAL
ncbi:MAG: hemolysin III family protein [Chloroflexi bacterium]|nr:hemolysin III family protein [Chloroflexota bacterium]